MKNKVLSLIFSTFLITSLNPVLGVSASEEATDSSAIEVAIEEVRAAGLISDCELGCSAGSKTVYLTAGVYGTEVMSKIGFKNIKIQRSTNQSTWTTERTVSDMISEDVRFKTVYYYPVTVDGGYYYRIVLDNYAKENTWWFPETQTLTTTSNSVWVS